MGMAPLEKQRMPLEALEMLRASKAFMVLLLEDGQVIRGVGLGFYDN